MRRVLFSFTAVVFFAALVFAATGGDEAYQKLMDGNKRFVSGSLAKKDLGDARRKELAKGQHPFATVVACSDSRVSPELLFDQGLGDVFVGADFEAPGAVCLRLSIGEDNQRYVGEGANSVYQLRCICPRQ